MIKEIVALEKGKKSLKNKVLFFILINMTKIFKFKNCSFKYILVFQM